MARIGKRRLGKSPTLVVAVSRDEPCLRQATTLGIDAIELRLDGLTTPTPKMAGALAQRLRRHGLPILATVRSATEGGSGSLDDGARAALYASALPFVDAVDVEIASAPGLASIVASARAKHKTVLLSYHDFRRTPPDTRLDELLKRGRASGADIVKLALTPRTRNDVRRLLAWTLRHADDDVVVIAMGALGSISRLALPLAGSLLTYTNVKPTLGQIPLRQFAADLRRYYPR